MGGESNRSLRLALVGLLAIATLTFLAYRLPPPRSAQAAGFSAARAKAQLDALIGDNQPHPMGSPANAQLRAALVARLESLGYQVQTQRGLTCSRYGTCGSPTNLIATRAGAAQGDLVLLAAHYDSVPAGPGASDDFVGVAVVLEIAQLLARQPAHRHPVALLLSDGEEAGLLGASLFVRGHPLAAHVGAAVNLEARGTSGPSLMFESGAANGWLMSLYRRAIARPISDSLFYVVYRALPNDTDFSVLKGAGIEGFNFALVGDVGHYHTPLDSAAHVDLSSLQQQGDNALAAVAALADAPSLRQPAGDAVFFDVLARVLVTWPAPVGLGLAGCTLGLLLLVAAAAASRGELDTGELLWGLLGALLALLCAALLAVAALWLSRLTRNVPSGAAFSWIAQPQGMQLACAALALLALASAAALVARRTDIVAAWLAVSIVHAVLFLALAWWLPGAGFVVGLPALAAALAGCLLLRRQPGRFARAAAVLAPLWAGWTVMLPVLGLQYAAVGSLAFRIEPLCMVLAGLPLLALLVRPDAQSWRRRLLATGALCTLAGLGFTLLMPVYSADWPLRLNLEYRLDADRQRAWWIAETSARRLPEPVAGAAAFERAPRERFPGMSGRHAWFAPAPVRDLPSPQLTADCAAPEGRRRLHLQSARGAPRAIVIFSADSAVREAYVAGATGEETVPLVRAAEGASRLDAFGLPPAGLDFEIKGGGALHAQAFDLSYELSAGPLQRARGEEASRSQDGDVTVVQRTVVLCPAGAR